jgi:hypothetical protein
MVNDCAPRIPKPAPTAIAIAAATAKPLRTAIPAFSTEPNGRNDSAQLREANPATTTLTVR